MRSFVLAAVAASLVALSTPSFAQQPMEMQPIYSPGDPGCPPVASVNPCPCLPRHAYRAHHHRPAVSAPVVQEAPVIHKTVVREVVEVEHVVVEKPPIVITAPPCGNLCAIRPPCQNPCATSQVAHGQTVAPVSLASRTDDGWINHQPGMAPRGSYPCDKPINGVMVHGHCWK